MYNLFLFDEQPAIPIIATDTIKIISHRFIKPS
jgi:hypothetical protein